MRPLHGNGRVTGRTDAEVSAITGQSRQIVEHYALQLNQKKLAAPRRRNGKARKLDVLESDFEPNFKNFAQRFVKRGRYSGLFSGVEIIGAPEKNSNS